MNLEIVPLEQNTPEWLAFRQKHLGASDAPILMEASKWCTPYKLWQRKLRLEPEQKETSAMRRGKELESIARAEFIKQKGLPVDAVVIKNTNYPFMHASMDGAFFGPISKELVAAVEIKVPASESSESHQMAMSGVIPEMYKWQLLHQMIVCNLQSILYFSWNENSSKIIEFSRNEKMVEEYLPKVKEFWDCVKNYKEPPLTDRDYVKRKDLDFLKAESGWKMAKIQLKEAEEREKCHRESLISMANDQCTQGDEVRLTKYACKGRVDTKALIKDSGLDEEKYRKVATIAWRIS
jgi:putative phage-type endonuclease